jgi:6-phosphogluconolactonase
VPQPPDLHVSADPAAAVGELIAAHAQRKDSIVLTGGRTPGEAYARAAELAPDWSGVDVWWGDERCVPPDDERSNYRLAEVTLLERLEHAPNVHRIRGELEPQAAADEYESQLAGAELGLLLLGLGADGHTASLFPGLPQTAVEDRRVTWGPPGLEPFVDRVTLTFPALRSARRIVFLVTGEEKAEAVARVFMREIDPAVPASLVRLAPVRVEAFLDAPAASRIGNT